MHWNCLGWDDKNGIFKKKATFNPPPPLKKTPKNYTFFFLLSLSKYQMILHVGECCWNIPREQRATEKKIQLDIDNEKF